MTLHSFNIWTICWYIYINIWTKYRLCVEKSLSCAQTFIFVYLIPHFPNIVQTFDCVPVCFNTICKRDDLLVKFGQPFTRRLIRLYSNWNKSGNWTRLRFCCVCIVTTMSLRIYIVRTGRQQRAHQFTFKYP